MGAYLDSSPTVGHATHIQARLEDKVEQIKAWDEECLLIGDLNRSVDKPTELPKTRLMQAWFDSNNVELLNDPKVHTRICPATGKESTLDLAVMTKGLRSSVVHYKVDKKRQWSLHGTVKNKNKNLHRIKPGEEQKSLGKPGQKEAQEQSWKIKISSPWARRIQGKNKKLQ